MAAVAEMVRSHPATTSEIRILCEDLQVLGRSEFKQLLKWRLLLKKDIKKNAADATAAAAAKTKSNGKKRKKEGDSSGEDEDEEEELDGDGIPVEKKDKATQLEEQLLEEMSEIKDRMDRRKKREKRRRRELKIKSRVRAAQLAQSEGIGEEDTAGPDGLFSLTSLKTRKGGVDRVADAAAPSDEDAALSSDDDQSSSESDIDSDEERLRYDATMDEYLEESYRSWKVRQRMKGAGGGVEKKRRRRLGMHGELDEEEEEEEEERISGSEEEESEDEEVEEEEGGGLIVSLDERRVGRAADAAAAANQWFSQELFDDADLEDEEELRDLHPAKRQNAAGAGNIIPSTKPRAAAAALAAASESEEEESDDEEPPSAATKSGKSKANGYGFSAADRIIPDSGMTAAAAAHAALKNERAGFEEVPMSDSDDGSDSGAEEFDALDDDQKAEVRALAKKFLRRKSKDDIMEAAYNRYAFHDDNLPKWFVEDENKYMRPAPQITAEEYKAAKEEMRAIDARPIRKVVEAKARKRKRMQAKLTQARQKAESIANQEDVPMKAKMREIEKLYARARASGNKSKKPGGGSRSDQYKKKKGPPLDARLRKDKRGMDAAVRRNKAKGRAPPRGAKAAAGGKGGKGGRR